MFLPVVHIFILVFRLSKERGWLSYQISYPGTNHMEQKYMQRTEKNVVLTVVVIVCIVILAVSVYMIGLDRVSAFLIPGNDAVTVAAFRQMQNDVKSGIPVKEAVTAFCEEIIEAADIQ